MCKCFIAQNSPFTTTGKCLTRFSLFICVAAVWSRSRVNKKRWRRVPINNDPLGTAHWDPLSSWECPACRCSHTGSADTKLQRLWEIIKLYEFYSTVVSFVYFYLRKYLMALSLVVIGSRGINNVVVVGLKHSQQKRARKSYNYDQNRSNT